MENSIIYFGQRTWYLMFKNIYLKPVKNLNYCLLCFSSLTIKVCVCVSVSVHMYAVFRKRCSQLKKMRILN